MTDPNPYWDEAFVCSVDDVDESTGVAELYGPGDPDWERDFERDSRASEREDVEAQKGTG